MVHARNNGKQKMCNEQAIMWCKICLLWKQWNSIALNFISHNFKRQVTEKGLASFVCKAI